MGSPTPLSLGHHSDNGEFSDLQKKINTLLAQYAYLTDTSNNMKQEKNRITKVMILNIKKL